MYRNYIIKLGIWALCHWQ